jgi:hypothetical protein
VRSECSGFVVFFAPKRGRSDNKDRIPYKGIMERDIRDLQLDWTGLDWNGTENGATREAGDTSNVAVQNPAKTTGK